MMGEQNLYLIELLLISLAVNPQLTVHGVKSENDE